LPLFNVSKETEVDTCVMHRVVGIREVSDAKQKVVT